MSREEIAHSVRSIIAHQIDKKEDDIAHNVPLEEIGLDSLDRVEVIMRIEEELVVEIDDEKAEELHTVDDLVDYITSQKSS